MNVITFAQYKSHSDVPNGFEWLVIVESPAMELCIIKTDAFIHNAMNGKMEVAEKHDNSDFECERWLIEVFHVEYKNYKHSWWYVLLIVFPLPSRLMLIKAQCLHEMGRCNHDRQSEVIARIKFVSNLHYNSIQNERIVNVTHVNSMTMLSCGMKHNIEREREWEQQEKIHQHAMCMIISYGIEFRG